MDEDERDEQIEQMVHTLDKVLSQYHSVFQPHDIAGVLLSRVVLLMAHDPETGKGLVRYVWERLDAMEQQNPGDIF